jgi:serine/threonine-protein kinase
MKHKGPIITLAAGLVVAAVLMVMNLKVTGDRDARNAAADAAANGAAAPTAEPTPPPTTPPAVPAPPGTYAGKVTGGTATIAIATKDGKAIAYLCDGRSTEAWLQGTAENGTFTLAGADSAALTATYADGRVTGTINSGGQSWGFSVPIVEPPSGLYRATADVRNAQFVGGWIKIGNEIVGLGRLGGVVTEIPPVDPPNDTVLINDTPVPVTTVDGTTL